MKFFRKKSRKAAISIFLTIILIPSMLLSAVLIDGSRYSSAKAIVQEASDLAAVSALADYNLKLKNEFGLFAIQNPDKLDEVYKKSLNATLMAYGLDDQEYSEMIWQFMKSAVTGTESYADASFLNLYDFQVDSNASSAKAMYPLAEKEVLKTQMVEYAKFRGIYVALDRMDILNKLTEVQSQAKENENTSDIMNEKMGVDEENGAADQAVSSLKEAIEKLMADIGEYEETLKGYSKGLQAYMEVIRHDNIYPQEEEIDEYTRTQANGFDGYSVSLAPAARSLKGSAHNVRSLAQTALEEAQNAVNRLDGFKSKYEGGGEAAKEMAEDATASKEAYEDYVTELTKITEDKCLAFYADSINPDDLFAITSQILNAVSEDAKRVKAEKEAAEKAAAEAKKAEGGESEPKADPEAEPGTETEIYTNDHYDFYNLEMTEKSDNLFKMLDGVYKIAIASCMSKGTDCTLDILKNSPWKNIQTTYASNSEPGNAGSDLNSFAENQSEQEIKTEVDNEKGAPRGEINEDNYNNRPSTSYTQEPGSNVGLGFYNKSGNLTASKNIMNQGKHSMILDIAETMRDDVLSLSYMFGTFKTRMTGVENFSSKMPESEKNSFYMPEWRYAHENGELDMRFLPKKDRKTVLRSEIEYLIYGNRTDAANEGAVYATIYAERMANNMIALYLNAAVKGSCHAAGAVASTLTLGIVPEPVFFWIILTAWAVAETLIEMDYLINKGYKIPLFKTGKNVLLTISPNGSTEGLISHYGQTGFFVTYEDYLLILLLLKGDDKRIMRSADLIEFNMKANGEPTFSMAKAYTYMQADTVVSLRYLFNQVMPFQAVYEESGNTGRLQFTSSIYMGY